MNDKHAGPMVGSALTQDTHVTASASVASSLGFAETFSLGRTVTVPVPMTVEERVDKWIYSPLSNLDEHGGLILLMIVLPVYERYLKCTVKLPREKSEFAFSKNSALCNAIGKHLGLTTDEAFHLWQILRNGLLHQAFPQDHDGFTYALAPEPYIVRRIDNTFWINPSKFRDKVVELARQTPEMWEAEGLSALPEVFRVSSTPR